MYSNIRSRAGLVALFLILISISFVSAIPVPISAPRSEVSSTLLPDSNPSHNGRDVQPSLRGHMSRAPAAARALSVQHNLIDTDEDVELVRRTSIFTKIKQGFQKLGRGIKSVAQKIGSGIKKVAQKIGSGIKKVAQKVGSGIKKVAQKIGSGIKKVAQKVGSGIKRVAQKVGSGIKKVAQKIGSGIKRVAQKVGSGIKKVAKKIGNGIRIAAKKVGHFMKTTGAKIAKFGLKVVQTVGTVVAKVAGFIPEIGKPLEKAIGGVAKAAGMISDKIHVKLGAKLDKGMKIMNKADNIMEYVPIRRDLSDQAFEQRDYSDAYYFEEHDSDDISLDQEDFYFDND